MFGGLGGELHSVALTLYTDSHVVRATLETRQRRISDILNAADSDFLVVSDANFDDFGTSTSPMRAEYAQINLASVLFAVVTEPVDPVPELRTPKVVEQALISIPPFKVVGQIHLMPERNMLQSLEELHGRFLPVTNATFWSERVGEARQTATMVAVNHARAQILAPHRETDPWAGLDRSAGAESARPAPGAGSEPAGFADAGGGPGAGGAGAPGSAERELPWPENDRTWPENDRIG